jgi:2-hydroxychromene-2-carboxylate isomerase
VFRSLFGQGHRIDDTDHLAALLADMKIDVATALRAAQSDATKARLRAQTDEAQRLGIYGAPSFTTADGELFWGNDRLERALIWATQER